MQTSYNGIPVPTNGQPIEYKDGKYTVPDHPIIPFIEGDGTGRDIWKASQRVFDAAVAKAYGGKRSVAWYEVLAGEKSYRKTQDWLPEDTVKATVDFRVSIKGPLTTPVGGGIRSLNVALRQLMDLYQCIRPVKYYAGVPSPVKHPELVDIVIFRENTEDIYAGIEFREGTPEAKKFIAFVNDEMLKGTKKKVRLDSGVGVKPISITGSKRLVRAAIKYALDDGRKTVTLVHKGNIQKFTEGAFREWGYEVAVEEFRAQTVTERESWILGNIEANPGITPEANAALIEPGIEFAAKEFGESVIAEVKDVVASIGKSHGAGKWKEKILINDRIADSIFQQIIIRPERLQRAGDDQPERRLHLRRGGGAGGRAGHRAGRQHRRRLCGLRGHARHGSQVCGQGHDQSRLGDSVRGDAVRLPGLEGSGAADRVGDGEDHRAEVRDLRLRAPDAGRDQGQDQRVCDPDDREYVTWSAAYRRIFGCRKSFDAEFAKVAKFRKRSVVCDC